MGKGLFKPIAVGVLYHTDLQPPCGDSDWRVSTLSSRGKPFCSLYTYWGFAIWTSVEPPLHAGGSGVDGSPQNQMHHPQARWRIREDGCNCGGGCCSAFPWNVHRGPLWPSGALLAAKCHMAGFQRAEGFRPERIQEKKRKTESGRRLNDPSYQLNSKLTWMASRAARQNEDFGWETHKSK